MKYFNIKSVYGVETVDQIDKNDFKVYSEYKKELISMLYNYRLAGMAVYLSNRCTKEWKQKD